MQMAGRGRIHKIQAQVVAVLALLALFTGVHLYWILGLLLSLVRLPDLWTPVNDGAVTEADSDAGRQSRRQGQALA
jgi:hypothetical protein